MTSLSLNIMHIQLPQDDKLTTNYSTSVTNYQTNYFSHKLLHRVQQLDSLCTVVRFFLIVTNFATSPYAIALQVIMQPVITALLLKDGQKLIITALSLAIIQE